MAEARIKVYNMVILKKHNINLLILVLLVLVAPKTPAQSNLQPSTSGLQPQSGQSQAPTSNLNQTGAVQSNSGGQSFLNQSTLRPLGVVSDPKQTTPEAIAAPSQTLKTDITDEEEGDSILPLLAGGSALIVIIGVAVLWRGERREPVRPAVVEESVVIPEPVKRVKKDKKSRKKRRQQNRR